MVNANAKLDAVLKCLSEFYYKALTDNEYERITGERDPKRPAYRWDLISKGHMEAYFDFSLEMRNEERIDIPEIDNLVLYLEAEKLIIGEEINGEYLYRILFAGIVFIENGGYTRQAEMANIEYTLKRQNYKLNKIELGLKRYAFWVALLGLLISAISLYKSYSK